MDTNVFTRSEKLLFNVFVIVGVFGLGVIFENRLNLIKEKEYPTYISNLLSESMQKVNEKDSHKGMIMSYGVNDSTIGYLFNTSDYEEDFHNKSIMLLKLFDKDILFFLTKGIKCIEVRNIIGQSETISINDIVREWDEQ